MANQKGKYEGTVEERTRKLIAQKFDKTLEEVTRDTFVIPGKEGLNLDSLDASELFMEFEEEFDISIPEDVAAKIQTVGDVVDCIPNAPPGK